MVVTKGDGQKGGGHDDEDGNRCPWLVAVGALGGAGRGRSGGEARLVSSWPPGGSGARRVAVAVVVKTAGHHPGRHQPRRQAAGLHTPWEAQPVVQAVGAPS